MEDTSSWNPSVLLLAPCSQARSNAASAPPQSTPHLDLRPTPRPQARSNPGPATTPLALLTPHFTPHFSSTSGSLPEGRKVY
eukprot:1921321-Rhodomonas_salina.2